MKKQRTKSPEIPVTMKLTYKQETKAITNKHNNYRTLGDSKYYGGRE
jgi:hypothetical protein